MDGFVDLHTHTTASDGTMSPSEIVRYAKASGLSAIAITDHDTVAGIGEAILEGCRIGLEVIPGIEISVDFGSEMHILGYFSLDNYTNAQDLLDALKKSRTQRNPKIIDKLNQLGFKITFDDVSEFSKGGTVGRPHIARALMKKGFVNTLEEAFGRYLGQGRPAYFKKENISPQDGIREIVRAGGIPVIAHPLYLGLANKQLDDLAGELAKEGLKGIEAYYPEHTSVDTGNILRIALNHGLVATGGSDFHGFNRPGVDIGVGRGNLKVPYECVEKLKRLLE